MTERAPETTEGAIYPINSTQLWARLLYEKHPEVTHLVLAYYYPNSVYKEEERRFEVAQLKDRGYLADGSYPPPLILSKTSYSQLLCSISSIMGTTLTNVNPTFEMSHQNPNLRLINSKSFVQFDFSCAINEDSLGKVIAILNHSPHDWYLLQSNISYHAIIDTLVDLSLLPSMWGEILERFSRISSSEYVQQKGIQLAESLKINRNSITGLRLGTAALFDQTFREIRETEGGFEETKKFTFVDWGHLNHSLKSLIEYFRGQSLGSGYLRISGKKDGPQPVLVAERVNQKLRHFVIDSSYFTRQPPFTDLKTNSSWLT